MYGVIEDESNSFALTSSTQCFFMYNVAYGAVTHNITTADAELIFHEEIAMWI